MKEYSNFNEWVQQVLNEEDEFSYRYIYDAYRLAENPHRDGLYYTLVTRTNTEGRLEYVIQDRQSDYALILETEEGRISFTEYLLNRFCPQTRNMEMWHNQRHQWYVDDLNNWVDSDGNPFGS
ncbi:hypothetical protein ANAEL_02781 [Anaerolineales bacterium]|nr:hypothetical protein ANAEL_02781 [Anaerolineales bacterium]